jgi:hypothetical protein
MAEAMGIDIVVGIDTPSPDLIGPRCLGQRQPQPIAIGKLANRDSAALRELDVPPGPRVDLDQAVSPIPGILLELCTEDPPVPQVGQESRHRGQRRRGIIGRNRAHRGAVPKVRREHPFPSPKEDCDGSTIVGVSVDEQVVCGRAGNVFLELYGEACMEKVPCALDGLLHGARPLGLLPESRLECVGVVRLEKCS